MITASYSVSRLYRKCGSLDISQPYEPPWPVKGIPLLLHFTLTFYFYDWVLSNYLFTYFVQQTILMNQLQKYWNYSFYTTASSTFLYACSKPWGFQNRSPSLPKTRNWKMPCPKCMFIMWKTAVFRSRKCGCDVFCLKNYYHEARRVFWDSFVKAGLSLPCSQEPATWLWTRSLQSKPSQLFP
jgi:hypothetical protein